MISRSCLHLILIPSYNTGLKVLATVREARRYWQPVWIVIDGSTDGSIEALQAMAADDPGLRVLVLPHNQGKGAAILHGLREAATAGYTHVLTMDADGQHPAASIPEFMAVSRAHPQAVIFGLPVFDASAPAVRVHGRKLSNGLANLQTLWGELAMRYAASASIRWRRCATSWNGAAGCATSTSTRSGRSSVLARSHPDQSGGAGEIFQRRGGRCFAFQLLARQRAADLDEPATLGGVCSSVAVVAWSQGQPQIRQKMLEQGGYAPL